MVTYASIDDLSLLAEAKPSEKARNVFLTALPFPAVGGKRRVADVVFEGQTKLGTRNAKKKNANSFFRLLLLQLVERRLSPETPPPFSETVVHSRSDCARVEVMIKGNPPKPVFSGAVYSLTTAPETR